MTSKTRKGPTRPFTLKDAFEVEFARREMERRARDEAERRQQEEDLARATRLLEALQSDPDFLAKRELTADRRRYTVSIDHRDFRIAAYFEAGKASVTLEEALAVMAQFLVDESR
jgi:hypothetical protein